MNCRDFERRLDFLAGDPQDAPLGAEARESLAGMERHAVGCRSCRELLELARLPRLPVPPAPSLLVEDRGDFTSQVLSRTSGATCSQAEKNLPDFVVGSLASAGDRELLAGHLEHCRSCSGLARELDRLTVDLRRLAIVRPEISLVDDVLRRTLPLPVRVRRWRTNVWPVWVRRPRFASELAFAATLLLVLVFGTPVSPLQAMPERAFEFARTEPFGRFEGMQDSVREEVTGRLSAAIEHGSERARSLAGAAAGNVGTLFDEVASWFENAEDEPTAETNQITEETS